jgi:hypothetical protein
VCEQNLHRIAYQRPERPKVALPVGVLGDCAGQVFAAVPVESVDERGENAAVNGEGFRVQLRRDPRPGCDAAGDLDALSCDSARVCDLGRRPQGGRNLGTNEFEVPMHVVHGDSREMKVSGRQGF